MPKCGFELSAVMKNRKRRVVEIDFKTPKEKRSLQNFLAEKNLHFHTGSVSVGSKLLAGRHLYTSLHSAYF